MPFRQVQLAKLNCLKPIFAILEKKKEEKGHATDPRMKFFGLACLSNLTSKNNHVENMIVQEGGLEVRAIQLGLGLGLGLGRGARGEGQLRGKARNPSMETRNLERRCSSNS